MEAASESAVRMALRVSKSRPSNSNQPKDILKGIKLPGRRCQGEGIVVFTRQFATMIDAVCRSCNAWKSFPVSSQPFFKETLLKVKGMWNGLYLCRRLRKHPRFQRPLLQSCSCRGGGWNSGHDFERLAAYIENR